MAVLLDIHLPMHTCSIWQPMPSVLAGGNLQWVGRLEFEGFPWLHTIREGRMSQELKQWALVRMDILTKLVKYHDKMEEQGATLDAQRGGQRVSGGALELK